MSDLILGQTSEPYIPTNDELLYEKITYEMLYEQSDEEDCGDED